MNKKFSTLVATLLLSGVLFSVNAASVQVLDGKLAGTEITVADKNYTFTKDIALSAADYWLIDQEGAVIDGKNHKFSGRIVVKAENVTIKNLKINLVNGTSNYSFYKNAITVVAGSVTITNNEITCAVKNEGASETLMANGISIFPTKEDGKYVVNNNTIKNANEIGEGGWDSAAIMVTEGLTSFNVDGGSETVTTVDLKDFDITTIGTNTFDKCGIDYSYVTWSNSDQLNYQYQVTPIYDETGKLLNVNAVQEAVTKSDKDSKVVFKGSAEELDKALEDLSSSGNIVVKTNDGLIVSGIARVDETIETAAGNYDLVASPVAGEYYLLATAASSGGTYPIILKEGKPYAGTNAANFTSAMVTDENLWTMSETKDADGDYTYVFTNKKGDKLTVKEKDYVQSYNQTPYDNLGVVFGLSGDNFENEEVRYFGLYRMASHTISAEDLNNLQKDGFYVNFTGAEGIDAFAGLLTADPNDNSKSFYLKNKDDKYIVAKATNMKGDNANQIVYAFELTDKKAEANKFQFFHTPKAAIEDHLKLDKIDSIQVEVPTATTNVKGWATLGTYLLTTENKKTLGASIETKLSPVSINLKNNVVNPIGFLQNGYAVITKLNEEGAEDDELFVATGCDKNVSAWAKEVVNPLEAQWVVTYKDGKYTLTNRENVAVVKEEIAENILRHGEDATDNIYTINGQEYKIEFKPFDESSNYYKFLAEDNEDLKDSTFVISYFNTIFNGSANVSADKEGVAFIGANATPVEFKANGAVKEVKLNVTYTSGTSLKTEEKKVLVIPYYTFASAENKYFAESEDGEKYVVNGGAQNIVIRMTGDHYNLMTVVDGAMTAKVYAGNNDSYIYDRNCMYADDKNTLFDVTTNNRPEYRRFGKTIEDGFNDIEGDLNKLKFFRTNDENTFLYENSANKNANNGNGIAKDSLNFLGETNLADKSASAQLPFLVDTAYIRNNTRKPLYMLAVRAGEWEKSIKVVAPCGDPDGPHYDADNKETNDPWKCQHATKKEVWSRTGEYLVTLADSAYVNGISGEIYNSQALYQGNVRLAFVPATHFENDTLVIESSRFRGTKEAANDTLCFVDKNGKQQMNEATFAFRLVDPTTVDDNKAEFYIEAMPNDKGEAQYVRIHNSVPVLVTDLDQAAVFDVQGAEEGEDATANEGIETASVKVIAGNGIVTVKGAAGKNVVITNVLGQTVANTVVASDEATIAAPAGVVIVAVEGEDAVKAIVK